MGQYEPLYLKYRPQTLDDLIGQDSVKQTLTNAINQNKLVHAYLFTGPRGAGKTSSARILAKCLNCESQSPTPNPCGTCDSCRDIANSVSLDVIEIDAASHGGVDDARALIEKVNLGTIGGGYRVYIIDEVHMLSSAAFNALLKVFEEPPEKVVFILATTEEDKVLATIKSRCQALQFRPISALDCIKRLKFVAGKENISISEDALEFIAKRSDGAMRDALGLLDQVAAFSNPGSKIEKELIIDLVGGIAREDLIALLTPLLARDAKQVLVEVDKLFVLGKEALPLSKELINLALEWLEYGSPVVVENFELVQIIDSLSELEYRLKQSSQAKNLLRASLLKLAHRADILVLKELLAKIEALESGATPVKPAAQVRVQAIAKPVPAPSKPIDSAPVAAQAAPVQASGGQEFSQYLSPACRGLLNSSKAVLISAQDGIALFNIPERFKFLKAKLEAKSDELIMAVSKFSPVTKLQVDVVANDAETLNPPHLDPDYQKVQARSLASAEEMAEDVASAENDQRIEDVVETSAQKMTNEVESVASNIKSTKLSETVTMAKTLFGAQILN